ncbi:MAG: type II toxin-antitoxin system RelE/ParE family toxin [Clostridiales bacterium]|nr:type II toxin-antitoxin system RelE/ParE family toxin [Clostridiales bacterium]MBO4578980.1 type II toxin-antitoxin system RelE/ParE family toxin [Clostridiales bacterium]
MEIVYRNNKLKKICTDLKAAERAYGRRMAFKIRQRINEIYAADDVEMMVRFQIGRCHMLKHDRNGQYAMDLVHPYRLIFEEYGDTIHIANILEIVDYH